MKSVEVERLGAMEENQISFWVLSGVQFIELFLACGPCSKGAQTSAECIYNSVKKEHDVALMRSIERLESRVKALESDKV